MGGSVKGNRRDEDMKKILIIEDEPNIRELILYNLKTNGYDGIAAEDGIMGITMVHREKPDLILLDLMLPGKSGYDICKELREEGNNVPIIMITAKTEETDKVTGLESGADDYISKPFGIREMMARIKAVLRRYEAVQGVSLDGGDTVISVDDLKMNVERHEVTVAGKQVDFTLKEFELLKYLAERENRVFSREQLLEEVWGYEYYGDIRTVDVTVRRLREKLEDDSSNPQYIMTKRGIGYYFKRP